MSQTLDRILTMSSDDLDALTSAAASGSLLSKYREERNCHAENLLTSAICILWFQDRSFHVTLTYAEISQIPTAEIELTF